MLCLAQFLSLPQPRSDAAAAASSRPWGRPGGPSMGTSYSTHLRGLSCPVYRTDSVTSSVDTPSCSVAPLGMRGSTTLENLHAAPADTESLSQVLRASAPSGQAMYSSMVTGSRMQRPPRPYVAHEGEGYTQQRTPQQV